MTSRIRRIAQILAAIVIAFTFALPPIAASADELPVGWESMSESQKESWRAQQKKFHEDVKREYDAEHGEEAQPPTDTETTLIAFGTALVGIAAVIGISSVMYRIHHRKARGSDIPTKSHAEDERRDATD